MPTRLTFNLHLVAGSPTSLVAPGTLLGVTYLADELLCAVDLVADLDVGPDLNPEQEREIEAAYRVKRQAWLEARGEFGPRTPVTIRPDLAGLHAFLARPVPAGRRPTLWAYSGGLTWFDNGRPGTAGERDPEAPVERVIGRAGQ